MNSQLFIKTLLVIALFAILAGCEIPPEPVATKTLPTEVPTKTPTEAPTQTPTVSVCIISDVVGLDQSAAEELIRGLELQPVKRVEFSDIFAAGVVISQEPAAETLLEPCEGYVEIVVSQGAVLQPTDTPGPTETPAPPTETPIPTPVPPTATPTPDPRLFFDDFETGVKPEWGMTGGFVSANGKLVTQGLVEGYIGDSSWTNYKINFARAAYSSGIDLTVFVRRQNRDNYMKMHCENRTGGWYGCEWFRVVNGEAQSIPGTPHDACYGDCLIQIEADNNIYRVFINGEQRFRFVDDTFSQGGVGLMVDGYHNYQLDSFEVVALP